MKSDNHIHTVLDAAPEFFFDLIGIPQESQYTFKSVVIKEVSRSMDGLLEPKDTSKTTYVVEFENRSDKKENIYPRIFVEMGVLQLKYPNRNFKAVLIFGEKEFDAKTQPWHSFSKAPGKGFKVYYLRNLLKKLAAKNPNHPLVAVFQPYIEKKAEVLVKKGKEYYDQIHQSDLPEETKNKLEEVFINWFMIRFKKDTIQEINKMLSLFETPLEETVAYKEISIKEGAKGEVKGEVKGEIKLLKKLFQEKSISKKVYQMNLIPLEKKLEVLENQKL